MRKMGTDILVVPGDSTRGDGFKEDRFRLHIRKKLFTMRMKHCHRLHKEVMDAPSLESTLQSRLGWMGV